MFKLYQLVMKLLIWIDVPPQDFFLGVYMLNKEHKQVTNVNFGIFDFGGQGS
jgi:hypothetical protein